MSKTIKVDKDGILDLYCFSDFIDITKVKFYTFKTNKDLSLIVKFYDKNRKLIKPYEQK